MKEDIYQRRDEVGILCRRYRVRRLAVFGSALRDDFDAAQSDIDFLVEFEPLQVGQYLDTYLGLIEGLTTLFSSKIDLLVWKNVVNPYIRRAVERSHLDLYAA